ncbi:hypothetical protein G8S49_11230 [Clostridium botulinum C]|uniref:Uncharacterized protein n=3 Tax=Clostridium TaxID=1485 RepID=A0A9Q4TL59_CLOBO|nr:MULTISPECIES: hypothetical protein [Clostridium]EGO86236.1 hypothetical protein CBCST_23005 [Clostridium botulinum C str. Stockholm]KEI18220.1 hypothetical protein Z960_03570 [Clostridium haemolyticum NCTC 9693]KGN02921.1 hypothetical protein Z961_07825 [Clostridium haemolyticum NCTC 8350]MCD3195725.1 hypothetical protein [Clostridium botulinum C]MCD3201141.1 hypothetical protein [Clostridium botulinum C]
MEWREKLNKLLDGELKLFEEDYVHGVSCIYLKEGKRVKAKIDFKNKIIYSLSGQVLRRCN